jgi:tricorn protease
MDIKWVSGGSNGIAYEQFGTIYLLDPDSGKSQKVNIQVSGDITSVRPKMVNVSNNISNFALSPTGARAVFEARGEIVTVPAEKGDIRNLTNSSGANDRDPAWSPDGKWIAYFSDESGEYALHLSEQSGMGQVKKINLGNPPTFFYSPVWSPDSRKITYIDKRLNVWYVDIEKGTPVRIDTDTYENPALTLNPSWSSDSRWVTYTKQLDNHLGAVFIYNIETGKTEQVTDGMSNATNAVFDKSGKYLYFTASTNSGPSSGWLDLSSIDRQITSSVYVVVLKKDLPSPLAPQSDEEKIQEEGSRPPSPPAEKPREPQRVDIDFEGINHRILALPMPARNYVGLGVGKPGVIFVTELPAAAFGNFVPASIHRFEMDKRRAERILEGVFNFAVSHNGEKILFQQGPRWVIASAIMPIRPGEGTLNLTQMEILVDPKAEWKQMYAEAWRIQRDFFYDPGLHGVDFQTFKKRYEPYLAGISHRADLTYLFQEMLGNMTVGHHNSVGGDIAQPNFVPVGLLGADYKTENGRYRFARVYTGENWNPQLRSPLTEPGVNVTAGEYLLSVNGREVRASDNVYSFFESTANKSVVIKVGPNPDATGSREVTVVPVANEFGLRGLSWIEDNRRKVDKLSNGKLAYIYLPDTGGGGYTNFNRYFFAQVNKEGAIIDDRFNNGGFVADYVLDYLRRPLTNFFAGREGKDFSTPFGAIFGPKVMLVNESSSSGGDWLPWGFRESKLGTLVGKRTWGGLVGIFNYPPLIDGGGVTAPRVAFYNLKGEWDVENYGVAPDVDIDYDPKLWREGRDSQLEKGVELLMESLRKNPTPKYKRPAYPNYQNGKNAQR